MPRSPRTGPEAAAEAAEPSAGELVPIAEALCAVPLTGFVAERAARVKAARAAGDRDLAARIAALPKPSAAAWLVDLLAHEDGGAGLQRLLETGAALRSAQQQADRQRLRALGAERRDLLAQLTAAIAERARALGASVSAAALEDVTQTLQAALVSEAAAAAVASGRLVRALRSDGLDPVDLTDAVAGGALGPPTPRPGARATRKPTPAARDERGDRHAEVRAAAEAERAAARQRAEDAERSARSGEREAADAAELAGAAEAAVRQRSRAAAALRAELEDLQDRAARADRDLQAAREASAAAHAAAADSARSADDLRIEADAAAARLQRLEQRAADDR